MADENTTAYDPFDINILVPIFREFLRMIEELLQTLGFDFHFSSIFGTLEDME